MPQSACLSQDVLGAYQCGALAGAAWDQAAAHLHECPSCLARLESLPTTDPVLQALRQTPPGNPPDDAAYRRALERLAGASPGIEGPQIGPGATLREYTLIEPLGEGGMGTVYKALHTRLDKVVALKVLRRGRHDASALVRFEREMRAAGRSRHPNLVQATDAGEVDGVPFLVMEFVDGTDLARLVRRHGPLTPADACEVARQAALGLEHAHRAGLIHRDVKPSNLILTSDGTVKVLDLGLALLDDAVAEPLADGPSGESSTGDQNTGLTNSNQAIGTRHYMAPEQWKDSHSVDARADIYGLGCTLFYLLTGKPPSPDSSAQTHAGPQAVLRRMIAIPLEDRFASAAETATALAAAAKGSNLPALAAGTKPTVRVRKSRYRWLAAAVVLAAAGFGTLHFVRARADGPPRVHPPIDARQAAEIQQKWADHLSSPLEVQDGIGMRLVLIPPGDLTLHSGGIARIEQPYWLGASEVTVGQFRAFVTATKHRTTAETGHGGMTMHPGGAPSPEPGVVWDKPGHATSDEHPVTQVSYTDAMAFCTWLSSVEHATYRLPTTKEWRWATKAGTQWLYFFGEKADDLSQYAWHNGNAPNGPQASRQLKPNPWGLYDTLGNVREWTTDLDGPGRKFRIACGGSTASDARQHTVEGRGGFEDWVASSGIGFRVLRELP